MNLRDAQIAVELRDLDLLDVARRTDRGGEFHHDVALERVGFCSAAQRELTDVKIGEINVRGLCGVVARDVHRHRHRAAGDFERLNWCGARRRWSGRGRRRRGRKGAGQRVKLFQIRDINLRIRLADHLPRADLRIIALAAAEQELRVGHGNRRKRTLHVEFCGRRVERIGNGR
jgi:hypothetical protein